MKAYKIYRHSSSLDLDWKVLHVNERFVHLLPIYRPEHPTLKGLQVVPDGVFKPLNTLDMSQWTDVTEFYK